MIHLLAALLLSPGSQSMPQYSRIMPDRPRGATPVTDKDLRPVRPPDCKTEAEVQLAVQQVRNGQPGDCWVRDITAFNRH